MIPITDTSCREYCFYPIVESDDSWSRVLQIQNYFSYKDDGYYTCSVTNKDGLSIDETKQLLWLNRKIDKIQYHMVRMLRMKRFNLDGNAPF